MPKTEGVSASLFEAMATNCYPIVTDLPGNRSWIKHRENGQLIKVNNFEMLADEIIWAHENREYLTEAIKRNRLFVEEHANYEINMLLISDKYHKLLEQ
jgi:glycosyltransferase involved in cell wall biosynthesis